MYLKGVRVCVHAHARALCSERKEKHFLSSDSCPGLCQAFTFSYSLILSYPMLHFLYVKLRLARLPNLLEYSWESSRRLVCG